MSITVGDILRVVATAAWLDGNINQNVFAAVIGGTGGPYDDEDIVDDAVAWADAMFDTLTAASTPDLAGTQVQVYVYDDVDDDYDEVGSAPWTWEGANDTDYFPRGVAALVNAKTTDPDVNGKKYLGGWVEAHATDGLWTPSALVYIANFAVEWTTGFVGGTSGADWVPAIWSPTRTNAYALNGNVVIPTMPAYQRRRKRGVGV
jgi:hypothetical protein